MKAVPAHLQAISVYMPNLVNAKFVDVLTITLADVAAVAAATGDPATCKCVKCGKA